MIYWTEASLQATAQNHWALVISLHTNPHQTQHLNPSDKG